MKRVIFLTCVAWATMIFTSCNETDGETDEFADWKNRNEQYYNNQYDYAKNMIEQGDTSWRIYRKWSLNEGTANSPSDYIVVNVLQNGEGKIAPIYTDEVGVFIRGRLIPTSSFTDGYIFYTTYKGAFNPQTAYCIKMPANGEDYVMSGQKNIYIDGIATALMYMHVGDHWRVYVPYALAYGASLQQKLGIPSFSTLIYDIMLVSIN